MNNNKLQVLIISLIMSVLYSKDLHAQNYNIKDSVLKVSSIQVQYSHYMPGGDMKVRFGNNSMVGVGFLQKTNRNYFWGAELNYLYGGDVKEKYVLDSLRTIRGQIISRDGGYGDVRMFERGFSTHVKAGKLFPVFGSNKNSGILVLLGVGFLQHRMHIEVIDENVKSLDGDRRKGYDRLTNGISFSQFVGYWYMSNNRRLNAFVGLDFHQALTENRRDWDYHAQRKLDEKRLDMLSGLKVGIVLPLYKRMPKDYYFR